MAKRHVGVSKEQHLLQAKVFGGIATLIEKLIPSCIEGYGSSGGVTAKVLELQEKLERLRGEMNLKWVQEGHKMSDGHFPYYAKQSVAGFDPKKVEIDDAPPTESPVDF